MLRLEASACCPISPNLPGPSRMVESVAAQVSRQHSLAELQALLDVARWVSELSVVSECSLDDHGFGSRSINLANA